MIKSTSHPLRIVLLGGACLSAMLAGAPAAAQNAPAGQAPPPAQAEAATQVAPGARAGVAPPATASTATEAPAAQSTQAGGLDEIVVTAQFREQNLQKTPLAITAVSGALLEARSQTNIADITGQAPSVTLKPQGANFGPALSANIRGVGQFDFNPALEPGVGLYVDDVYFATLTGSIFDLLDLDRVEVLRGPQGTLAGKNSIGGAIKLYSKKPTGSGDGFVSATYGSRDRIDLRGSADIKLADNLFARVAGVAKRQDGYIKRYDFGCLNPPGSALNPAVGGVASTTSRNNCLLGRESEVNYQAVRGQLRFDDGGPIEINVSGDYTNDSRTNSGSVLTASDNQSLNVRGDAVNVPQDSRFLCGRYCNYATYSSPAGVWKGPVAAGYPLNQTRADGRVSYKGWGVAGTIDWKLSDDLALKSITAYRAYSTDFTNDEDLGPLAVSTGINRLTFHSVSQELRLNGGFFDNLVQYTIGGFYQDQRSVYSVDQDIRYATIPLQFAGNDPVNADTKAVFAQLTVNPTDKLSVIGGLRYTKEHKDYTYGRLNTDGTVNPFLGTLNGLTGVYNGDRVDYRVNAQYQFTPRYMAYAQVSTGFKGGGVNPRPFSAAQVQSFDPETLTSYEVGFKGDFFDRMARLNLAAFYSDYKDIQLILLSCPQFGGAGPCLLPANAGNAKIKGFEAELSLRPADGLSIDGALSYIDFDYKSINPLAGGAGNPAGPQLDSYPPYTPRWKWSLGAQYVADLGDVGTITPRVDAAYQSTIYGGAANTALERIPRYTIVNARLTWKNRAGDLEVSGEVSNLFDKYYYLTALDLVIAGEGVGTAQPGRPREWALTVKKRF